MGRPEFELKETLRLEGIAIKEVADSNDMPYSTLSSYLNGFTRMPENVRRKIMAFIRERQQQAGGEQ